ncbi:MAG: serine/threonine protein kinase [Proteobacteria bacterium]|jgi:serine/threonine protein kinase|nr:serine/threonine protein kinase [Pseudomonadota bacterium]
MPLSVQDPLVGTLFDHRYLINFLVARGGMGNIYQAHDTKRGHIVAVKLLRAEYGHDPIVVQRFLREAKVVQSLHHENICMFFDTGMTEAGEHYFTMEFLEGQALDEIIAKKHVLPPDVCVPYIIQAARGLCEAHAHGIVHRDMKPGNIFVVQTPNAPEFVKILDFGVAKTPEFSIGKQVDMRLTNAGSTVGTPFYMSPEQIRGEETVDARTDIYALGIILWECLFGLPPYVGDNLMQVFEQTCNFKLKLPKLASQYKKYPKYVQLYAILTKALEKDVRNRYATMQEFMHDLEKCFQVNDASFNPGEKAVYAIQDNQTAGILGDIKSFILRQSPIAIGIVAAVFAILLIGGIVLIVSSVPEQPAVEEQAVSLKYKFYSDIPCEIQVRGKTVGTTPLLVDLDEKPPFVVEFIAKNGKKRQVKLTSNGEEIRAYAVNLEATPVQEPKLNLTTVPEKSTVIVNGESYETPCSIDMSMGTLNLTIKHDGFMPERYTIEPNEGNFDIETKLVPIPSEDKTKS